MQPPISQSTPYTPATPLPVAPIPPGRLFDPKLVGLSTFLGGPIGGATVLAMNYRQLGRSGPAINSVLLGLLGTVLLVVVAFIVPDKTPKPVLYLPPLLGMIAIGKALQGELFAEHKRLGGEVRSGWGAAGIGLAWLAVIAGGIFGYVYLTSRIPGTRISVGSKDEIYYQGTATADEARALGDGLKQMQFLSDSGATVLLSKGTAGTIVSFVVHDGAWDKPGIDAAFVTIGRKVAPSIGGLPITIKLMNDQLEVKKEIPVTPGESKTVGDPG